MANDDSVVSALSRTRLAMCSRSPEVSIAALRNASSTRLSSPSGNPICSSIEPSICMKPETLSGIGKRLGGIALSPFAVAPVLAGAAVFAGMRCRFGKLRPDIGAQIAAPHAATGLLVKTAAERPAQAVPLRERLAQIADGSLAAGGVSTLRLRRQRIQVKA